MSSIDLVHWGGKDRISNLEDNVAAVEAKVNGGSLPFLSTGGPPTAATYTYATNDVFVDANGVAWQCTAGGAPGTWRFFGTGFMPGITSNDNTSGTDYGAIINAYMATLGPYQDTPRLPPAAIYCGTEVIPPQGVTLVGSRWSENANLLRSTVLRPLNAGMARVASLSNVDSGMRNLVVDGLPIGNANVATKAFGVYAAHCKLDHFSAIGGSTTTFDANASATNLDMDFVNIQQTGGIPTNVLVVAGSDWICADVRSTGNITWGGGGNEWSDCHFVSPSTGSATPFTENGGQLFTGCYFDSMPAASSVMIDRSGASTPSEYTGCFYYQNITGNGATSTVFKETTTAGAGAVITGGLVRAISSTTFGYFMTGAIASTLVANVKSFGFTFQTAFTDATPPLGGWANVMNNGVLAYLGGHVLGSNQKIATRDSLRATGLGVLAEPFPASTLVSAALAPATQQVAGVAVGLKRGDVVTGIMTRVAVAAAGTNPTTVRFGLADSTGKILVLSADRGTAGSNDATTVFALGPNKIAFTAPLTIPADDLYFPVFVVNGTWGTTQPTMGLLSVSTAAMMGAAAGSAPANFVWTGQTDLPAVNSSVTITSLGTRSYYLAPY
jgi:hypothetical protein